MPAEIEIKNRRNLAALVGALLLGTGVGAGAMAWSHDARRGPETLVVAEKAKAGMVAAAATSSGPINSLGGPIVAPAYNPSGFADLVEKVAPAVVEITTTEQTQRSPRAGLRGMPQGSPLDDMFRRFFGDQGQGEEYFGGRPGRGAPPAHALGSGFIIDPSGYIVTNNHVVNDAREIKVTLHDGTRMSAKVIGRDEKTDLALIKLDNAKSLPYLAFGDSDRARVGEWVVAVGNPFGLGGTVTAGIISAHGRNINNGPYDDYLQIDAPINPGNSGGPLFNQAGQVIGIDTAIYSPSGGSVGIGFAIPSNLAKRIVAQLREHGSVARGWLGVQMQSLTPTLAKANGLGLETDGVLVNRVEKNSPADRAGIKDGDIITNFNGKQIKAQRDLASAVADVPAGKSGKITIWRDRKSRSLDVTIGALKTQTATGDEPSDTNEAPGGLLLGRLTPEDRSALGLGAGRGGVVIEQVAPDSPAGESGLRSGDVILRIGEEEVSSPDQAKSVIRAAQRDKKEAVSLLVLRDGTTYYVGLQLADG